MLKKMWTKLFPVMGLVMLASPALAAEGAASSDKGMIALAAGLAIAIAAQVVLASGCMGPVPAAVTRAPTTPLKANPAIYLQAVRQMPRVAESLRTAGVQFRRDQLTYAARRTSQDDTLALKPHDLPP